MWRAGYRDWDDRGQEVRVEGEVFVGQRAAWERSQAVAEEWYLKEKRRMIRRAIFTILCVAAPVSIASAMDFDDCARAARNLRNAAEEGESAKQQYESAKSSYESACGPYGYDRGNSSACGPYGYNRSTLESAKSQLDSKTREVSDYASTVSSRCEGPSLVRDTIVRDTILRRMSQDLQSTKQALQSCQEGRPKQR